jgi:hypothetical protein
MKRMLLLSCAIAALLGGCPEFPRDALHYEGGAGEGPCRDGDGDGYSSCADDCDDGARDANPDQTKFFTSPHGTSFDYDCDGKEEPQHPDLVSCVLDGEQCTGEGWQDTGTVPACGESGVFFVCQLAGKTCSPRREGERDQPCR